MNDYVEKNTIFLRFQLAVVIAQITTHTNTSRVAGFCVSEDETQF